MTPRFFDAALSAGQPAIGLVDADPELFAGLSAAAAADARARATAPSVRLDRGGWSGALGGAHDPSTSLGLLVVDGLLMRTVRLRGQSQSELLGPEDVLRPWQRDDEDSLPLLESGWSVLEPATLAVLDARFLATACSWPPVLSALMGRAVRRSRWLAVHRAIVDLRRVDERLVLLFAHLADRWGRVRPDGVVVPVRVTHDVLAQLVGAQRPTVSSALQTLRRRGLLRRTPDRSWLLARQPAEELLRAVEPRAATPARIGAMTPTGVGG